MPFISADLTPRAGRYIISYDRVFSAEGGGMSGGSRFRRPNGPSVPPKSDYSPTRSAQKPPGYAAIEAVSAFPLDAPEWNTFVRDVMQMPETYAPAVQDAIQQQRWKISPNPIAAVRTAAHQAARRMGLQ